MISSRESWPSSIVSSSSFSAAFAISSAAATLTAPATAAFSANLFSLDDLNWGTSISSAAFAAGFSCTFDFEVFATLAASIMASLRSDMSRSILSYLSSAFFCVAFLIIPSRPLVTSGLYCLMSGSSSLRCLSAMAIELLASKGTLPVAISNIVIPREYISLFSFTYPPLACSGEK